LLHLVTPSDTHTKYAHTHSVGLFWTSDQSLVDVYLTKHNTQKIQTYMPLPGFEPTITGSERPQTHVLDSAATRISCNIPSDTNSGKHNTNTFAKEKANN